MSDGEKNSEEQRIETESSNLLSSVKKHPKAFGIAAVTIVVIATVGVYFGLQASGYFVLGQNSETFKQALLEDSIVANGIASNQYLNDSPYDLVSYELRNLEKTDDNTVSADISATIENANYQTELELSAKYYNVDSQAPESLEGINRGYSFELVSDTTHPKKGIDFDTQFGLTDCNAALNEDGVSCTVVSEESFETWFASSNVKHTYPYTFTGKGWQAGKVDDLREVTYKNMDGSYAAKSGDLKRFTQFEISELDPEKGTFVITYTLAPEAYSDWLLTYSDTNGTMLATINPERTGSEPSDDGYTYNFDAQGNSNAGNGAADCKGYLTTNDSGESIIKIDKINIDCQSIWKEKTTYPGKISKSTTTFSANNMMLYKQ